MSEETQPEENDQDRPEVEEVVSDFGDVRVRSGFQIEEVEPGVLGINIFGPVFEFDCDDLDDLDLDDEEDDQESHDETEE